MPITLSPAFYENADPFYRKFVIDIEQCLNSKFFKGDHLLGYCKRFIQSNMLSKEVWYGLFVLLEDRGLIWEAIALFEIPSMYQLYYPQDNLGLFSHFGYGYFLQRKLIFNKRKSVIDKWQEANEDDDSLKKDVQLLIDNVTYPHPDLKKIWQCYEQNTCSTPSKTLVEKYNKALELHQKLTTVNASNEKWLEMVLTAEDVDFVKHNFEYILGSELKNKKIWEMYLSFLEAHDIDTMLHTYSKYCRLFREDKEMEKRYRNAVKEHCENGIFTVPWDETYNFEKCDPIFFTKLNHHDIDSKTASTIEHQPLTVHFTPENAVRQTFPFKESLMYYILKNASASVQQKLSFTCKYIFLRHPTLICHSLKITDGDILGIDAEWYQQSVNFKVYEMNELHFYNIYLSTVLYINSIDRKSLSKLIPKMIECNAKYVAIVNQDITLNEFKFLVGHGNVIELTVVDVRIFDENRKVLQLEDIIAFMPAIERISGDHIPTSNETLTKLLKISFTSKFDKILLRSVNVSHFNPEQVIEFLKKNVAADSNVGINFLQNTNNEEEIDEFAHTVYFGIWGFWTGSERPSFRLLP